MALSLKLRDFFMPRSVILQEAGLKPGSVVLDFGCGPGSYAIAAAEMVGAEGKVYALDIHPLAVQMVQKAASKKGLKNIETINSDCATGLQDGSVDVAFLYDTLHALSQPGAVLKELHRVLKSNGLLSFNDHHMKEDEIISVVTRAGLYRLSGKGGRKTYTFVKRKA
jgi:ubiquinone/menaquinone biosynthesis C-methylase UbiE